MLKNMKQKIIKFKKEDERTYGVIFGCVGTIFFSTLFMLIYRILFL